MTDISDALAALRPGAEWNLRGNTYADIEWLDQAQSKPTPVEVSAEVTRQAEAATAESARVAAIRSDAGRADMLARLQSATPAQIDTWLTNNVTNLAQARTVLGIILKLIALDARK